MPIGVVATLKVQPGKAEEFEATFRELAPQVRSKEPGNKLYQCYKSRKDANTYVVMEVYESQAAIDAHREAPHVKALFPKLGACMAGAPDIHLMDPI